MLSETLRRARTFLASARNADASWPYVPGKPSGVEPTCYAAMALQQPLTKAPGPHLQWEHALTLLTLQRLNGSPQVCGSLTQTLLNTEVQHAAPNNAISELDSNLRGWSWVDGTFSWVEPTSYAVLALKAAGQAGHPRVREGERLLLDRVCFDGGWNYGNRKVRGEQLESMMPTTALAAMALQQVPGAANTIDRALGLLGREAETHPSALSLALTILCFGVFNQPAAKFVGALTQRQQADGSWRGQVHLTALSVLALQTVEGGANVFRI